MLNVYYKYNQLDTDKLLSLYSESIGQLEADLSCSRYTAEKTFCDYISEVFFRNNGAAYYVWTKEDIYVSALRLEPYDDGLLLSAMETHKMFRHQGFATALLMDAVSQVSGKNVYSHIHKRNLTSIHIHAKCGFVKIQDYGNMLDGSVSSRYATYKLDRKPAH